MCVCVFPCPFFFSGLFVVVVVPGAIVYVCTLLVEHCNLFVVGVEINISIRKKKKMKMKK